MEELIKRLERVIQTGVPDKDGMHPISAETVLEVVKAQLSTNLAEVGTDCISRQAAIDALRKLREEDIEDYGCEIPEGFNQDHLDRATFAIKQLPPIHPVNNSEMPNSSDVISRQAAIAAIDECYCGGEDSCGEPWIYKENAVEAIQMIEPIQPKTAKRIIGKSRGGMTLWYQCNVCNEPVDEKDAYCRGCGRRLIDG